MSQEEQDKYDVLKRALDEWAAWDRERMEIEAAELWNWGRV